MAWLDDETESLVQQLYDAWSTNADPTSYLNLRDQLLSRHERVDTCIATLRTVVTVTCPQITETERYFDPKWEELFTLAESIESSSEEDDCNLGKRKRTYNEVHRLRNLAVVSALWSPGVVRHYGWNNAAQGCLRLLKTCALRFPHFGKQLCPYLNRVLLDRHCEAIVSGHLKTLNEAPLQCYRDLNILAEGGIVPNPEAEELWVTSSDGAVPVDSNGHLLKDVRPYHVQQHLLRRDRYGMLVARGECRDPPVITHQQSDFSLAPSMFEEFLAHDDGLLETIPGLTIAPSDIFTPLGVNSLLDSLVSSDQAETLPHGPKDASTITLPSDNAVDLALNPTSDASTITLPRDDAVDLALNPDEVPISDNTFSSDVSEQCHAESDNTPNMGTGTGKNSRRRSQEGSVVSLSKTTRAARLPASSANPRARIGAPAQPKGKPTMEDELRNRYNQMLSTYIQRLSEEAVPGYDQRRVRSQWLTSDTKWARIWSISGSKSLLPGTATSKADCDVLYCSVDGILEAARSGEVFQKPVVIKESFSDAGMHNYERFLSLLEDASSSDEQVEVRCIDITQPMHEALGKFTAYLRSRPGLSDGLWMSTARSVVKCHRPLFTMLNRFRLLESLSEGLHDRQSNLTPSPPLKPMSVSFNTISFPGAFSGAYLNTSAGSWQRNLSGVKLWVFVPETGVPLDELANLANEGNDWLPRGKQRLVVLEENDVLFVPPGLRLVQAWHAPTTCLTEQGMLWDDLNILSIVESITWGHENQAIQDDRASQQLFRMINNLDRLIREQPDRFRRSMAQDEFISRFREAGQSWLVSC
ncbi:hypothetical protein NA57DRAFT_57418 [Rhizodiscina lignyota]|uniref:JmjC domain-containing protein n=1 Tax=Rhizodiscina lignyota TaxID=1504668 RepID=A0A9P4IF99_9PEZI|nr:hypothetical protein NA57DRAFT_57418 [Rhizodiscina lignyota]